VAVHANVIGSELVSKALPASEVLWPNRTCPSEAVTEMTSGGVLKLTWMPSPPPWGAALTATVSLAVLLPPRESLTATVTVCAELGAVQTIVVPVVLEPGRPWP
jgi:hypothetical protein